MKGFNPLVAFKHVGPHSNTERIGGMIHEVIECGMIGQSMIEGKLNLAIDFVALNEDLCNLRH